MHLCHGKVLLIHPEETRSRFNFLGITEDEPLDIETVHTVLKNNGYETYIFDPDRQHDKIENVLKSFNPTAMYIIGGFKQVPYIIDYVKKCKQHSSAIITIIGGVFAEHNYEYFYMDELDFITRSLDPEVVLKAISSSNSPNKLAELNGLCYQTALGWKKNQLTPYDIKNLPEIDRSYFYKYKHHFRFHELNPIAFVRFAYSCQYNCTFCHRAVINGGKYTTKDLGKFVEEIEKIDCENIYIYDDNFLFSREVISEFIRLVKEKDIKKKFVCFGRCDFIVKNKDLVLELKEIGFAHILVGIESANDQSLNSYKKRTSVDENVDCINYLNEVGIDIVGTMITDLDFKRKDFVNLYKWIKAQPLKHPLITIYTPMPGTKEYEKYKDKLITKDLAKWDFMHLVVKPTNMSLPMFYIHHYSLLLKLFFHSKKYGIYDFLDYKNKLKSIVFGAK